MIVKRQQSVPDRIRKRRAIGDIKAQMNGRRDLVDVLPAGALRPDRRQLNLGEWDGNVVRNDDVV